MLNIVLILLAYGILIYAADPRLTSTHSRPRISKRDLEVEKATCYTDRDKLRAIRRHDYEELWTKEVEPWEGMVPRLYPDGTHRDLSFYFQWATPLTRVWVLFYEDMAEAWRERYFHEDAQAWLTREIKLSVVTLLKDCVIKEKREGYFNYDSEPFHFLVSLGKPSQEVLDIYTQLSRDMLSASHVHDIPQAHHTRPTHNRRQMASQQPPPPIPSRPPPALPLRPSSDRPRTPPDANPKFPGLGQASSDPRWPGSSSRQDSLDGHDTSPLDKLPLLSPTASGTFTAGLNFASGKPLTNEKPQSRNGGLQPRADRPQPPSGGQQTPSGGEQTPSGGPQPPNGGPQPPSGGPQPPSGGPQPQGNSWPASPQQSGQGTRMQGYSKPPLAPPPPPLPSKTDEGEQAFPLRNGSESLLMPPGTRSLARPLFPPTGEPSSAPDGTQPVASATPQRGTGPPTADIRESTLWHSSPLYEPSAALSRIRTTGTPEAVMGQGYDPEAGTSRPLESADLTPATSRRTSVDYQDWRGTPFPSDLDNILDTPSTARGAAGSGRRRRLSQDLKGFPQTPFRTRHPMPDRSRARTPPDTFRSSSNEFSFSRAGTNTGLFMDTTALDERYGRYQGAASGVVIIPAENLRDVQSSLDNVSRVFGQASHPRAFGQASHPMKGPGSQQMIRGTSAGEGERDPLLDSQATSDAANPEDQDISFHGGVNYRLPPGTPQGTPQGTPPGTPSGTPSETAESESQAHRRGKRVGCFYFPPYSTSLEDRLQGDMTLPPGERHPPGVEQVTGEFLGVVAKFCGGIWVCPCATAAFCCNKFNLPERCGQAYSVACGETYARRCRDECPANCQPEQCASLCRECGYLSQYCQNTVSHPENRACVTCVSGWGCLAFTMTCTQILAPWIIHNCLTPWPGS